jgi:hypothetical protein
MLNFNIYYKLDDGSNYGQIMYASTWESIESEIREYIISRDWDVVDFDYEAA